MTEDWQARALAAESSLRVRQAAIDALQAQIHALLTRPEPSPSKTEDAARIICDFMNWPDDGPAWDDAAKLASKVREGAYKEGWNDREADFIECVERIAPSSKTDHAELVERLRRHSHEAANDLEDDLLEAIQALSRADEGWRPIDEIYHSRPILAGRVPDKNWHNPTTAFRDVTGVWRVYRSVGGMSELPFEPTHYREIPPPPPVEGE